MSDAAELARLRNIEIIARILIKEWRSYGGDIKAPIVDQLESLEEELKASTFSSQEQPNPVTPAVRGET